jgi:hypothetical protein
MYYLKVQRDVDYLHMFVVHEMVSCAALAAHVPHWSSEYSRSAKLFGAGFAQTHSNYIPKLWWNLVEMLFVLDSGHGGRSSMALNLVVVVVIYARYYGCQFSVGEQQIHFRVG